MERVAVMYQPYVSRAMALLAVTITVSAFLYGVFLLEAVAHAASSTTAQAEVQTINGQLGTLEAQYLTLTQSLTPQKAANLGFVTPKTVDSIYAKGETDSLSFQGI